MSFSNIRIVLVCTTHPGNIGAAARAMKTMGLSCLHLVSPCDFPSGQARALASGATDLLDRAVVVESLAEAVADCEMVIGASARVRGISLPLANPRDMAAEAIGEAARGQVALVFGREDRGLTNEELSLCHRQVHIPADPAFSSLNLAAAVQVISYELRVAAGAGSEGAAEVSVSDRERPVCSEHMEDYYRHLRQTLDAVGFFKSCNPDRIMARLRCLYARSRPDQSEYNILRGILSETQSALQRRPTD
ncbi:MAG: RNA methyltransferase [Kistimonas sp.]|nr:RNA methyltransferase [Kistimonas sp.]